MASAAQDIATSDRLAREVSHSLSFSTSPSATFHSPSAGSFSGAQLGRTATGETAKPLKPFDTGDIKILLLENVNQTGQDILSGQGYQVEALKTSLPEDQLIAKIRWGSLIDKEIDILANDVLGMCMSLEFVQRQS